MDHRHSRGWNHRVYGTRAGRDREPELVPVDDAAWHQRLVEPLRRDEGELWGKDVNGLDLFAVWPHRRFAEACRHLHWAHRHPTLLRLDDFLDLVIPKLIADVVGVAVFPLPNLHCTAVDARQLQGRWRWS